MPAYEIRYLDKSNALAAKFRVACRDDNEAKAMAHAIEVQMDAARQIAVWEGQRLIFTRPLNKSVPEEATVFEAGPLNTALAAAAPG